MARHREKVAPGFAPLAGFVEVAISLLDAGDSDPDLEDNGSDTGVEDGPEGFDPEEDRCLAGDDGCGPVVTNGRLVWGSDHEDQGH